MESRLFPAISSYEGRLSVWSGVGFIMDTGRMELTKGKLNLDDEDVGTTDRLAFLILAKGLVRGPFDSGGSNAKIWFLR